jgi:mono/diheme cytochrome c family protein
MIIDTKKIPKWLMTTLVALAVVVGLGAWFAWYEFFREEPEQVWEAENGHSAEDMRFLYGSVGAERDAGIPYWIMYVLPRVFPDKLPGPQGKPSDHCLKADESADKPGIGGYAAFGLAWEQGHELPVGFSTKVIGFRRVAQNCAICHTASYRSKPGENPTYIPTGPNHTFNLEALFRFLVDCAEDPRFNADTLLTQIEMSKPKDFTFIDGLIYRFILIPQTKKQLIARRVRFDWIYQCPAQQWPEWGRGRDDAMNLTKYFLTTSPMDPTFGPTDMPSIWNLKKYERNNASEVVKDTRMNLAGDSYDAHSVIIDSALGLLSKAPPSNHLFLKEIEWLENYLGTYPSPSYQLIRNDPSPSQKTLRDDGKKVFDCWCARCHASEKTGKVMSFTEVDGPTQLKIGTDEERIKSWNGSAAVRANTEVKKFGIDRRGLVEENPYGYVVPFLDGIWLRAPYLHNGSVPSLRDLLKPAVHLKDPGQCSATVPASNERPRVFYRGYDVYDAQNAGFVSTPEQAARLGVAWIDVVRVATRYDVCQRSNGNGGHEFGVNLPDGEKEALLEYLRGFCDPVTDHQCDASLYPTLDSKHNYPKPPPGCPLRQ